MAESQELAIKSAFQEHIEALDTQPKWWKDLKREAFSQYELLPAPHRKDESWRFGNVKGLDLSGFRFGEPVSITDAQSIVSRSNVISKTAGRFVFADNQTLQVDKLSPELSAKGVIWVTIKEAIQRHGEILKDYFMKQAADLGSKKFAELHSAFLENGALLYVPKGVEVEDPFVVYNWANAENTAILPHTLIIAEEFSSVSLIEINGSTGEQAGFSCGVNHIFAGVGSKVSYALQQDFNEQTLGFQINSNIAGKDAQVKTVAANFGCHQYRSETHGQIHGNGAKVEMLSLALPDKKQEIDQRTLQSHFGAHANSDLLFKNALLDDSKTIFSGLIKVAEDAQHTDAYQTNRNLLLNNRAEANSLPGLEIETNDVRCSHGATTSQIEEEEVFYMLARGIPMAQAQELIVYGFFEEILERMDSEELAESARRIIQKKFRNSSR